MATWEALVAEATALGYAVELVEYCESHLSPGFLGAGLGVCIYGPRLIRIREKLREEDRCFVLEHELDHARNEHRPKEWHRELDSEWGRDERKAVIASYLYEPRDRGDGR